MKIVQFWKWLLAVGLIIFTVTGLPRIEINLEGVYQWLPRQTPAREEYDWFVQGFGVDDFAIISWEGATLDDPRVDAYAAAIVRQDTENLVDRVTTGPELVRLMVAPPLSLTEADANERLRDFLIGPDGRQTAVMIRASPIGTHRRRDTMTLLRDAADEIVHLKSEDLRFAGGPFLGECTDRETRGTLYRLVPLSCLVSVLIAWWSLGNARLALCICSLAGAATVLTLALVGHSGLQFTALLTIIPTLIFVLSVSAALHLSSYEPEVRRLKGSPSFDRPARAAAIRRLSWRPCVISAVSTAIGLGSLSTSRFEAVHDFGVFSSLGVLLSVSLLFIYLPELLLICQPAEERQRSRERMIPLVVLDFAVRWHRLIVSGFVLIMVILVGPLLRTQATTDLEHFFASDSDYLRHSQWIEEHLGPIETTELVVVFPENDETGFLERATLIREIGNALRQLPEIDAAFSDADMLPNPAEVQGVFARGVQRSRLKRARAELLEGANLADTDRGEAWRISLRYSLMGASDIDGLSKTVKHRVRKKLADRGRDDASIVYTGLYHLYYTSQQETIEGLIRSLALAVLAITPLMMLGLRSVRGGLLAMIPNVWPIVVVFGLLSVCGIPLDLGMMTTASLALGISVDDTAHFLMRYQQLIHDGRPGSRALSGAFRHCSLPLLQTTLACGMGILVMGLSSFAVISRLSVVIVLLLLTAVLCDLVLLPALLSSRLGRVLWIRE